MYILSLVNSTFNDKIYSIENFLGIHHSPIFYSFCLLSSLYLLICCFPGILALILNIFFRISYNLLTCYQCCSCIRRKKESNYYITQNDSKDKKDENSSCGGEKSANIKYNDNDKEEPLISV